MDVFLWAFNTITESDREALKGFLLEDELIRLSDFSSKQRADEFLCGRSLLRWCLGQRKQDSSVPLLYQENGKPFLPTIEISLTHSKGALCLALGESAPVGMDIEFVDPERNFESLKKRVFTKEEAGHFESLSPQESLRFFYHSWVLKEAEAKRSGLGLTKGKLFQRRVIDISEPCFIFEWQNFAGAVVGESIEKSSAFEVSLNDGAFECSKVFLKSFFRDSLIQGEN